jgi:hypothetical protein
MKAFIILCMLLISSVFALPSSVSFYSVAISLQQDTLFKVIEIRGRQGSDRLLSRITHGFNPETQSITLERALFSGGGLDFGPVPEWAVDTLSGSGNWPLSLVTAFPALREGMVIDYSISIKDWSGNWEFGPWAVFSPFVKGIYPDTCRFSVSCDMLQDIQYYAPGYDISRSREILEFTATDTSSFLIVSPFSDFEEVEDFLLKETAVILDSGFPPDLREAALQATSAGADGYSQSLLARTLLCNSIIPAPMIPGTSVSFARGLQEILDTRTGTPLEMAMVYAAMCIELGMNAEIVPAGSRDCSIAVPDGWDRYLVRIGSGDGFEWYMEPSAFLTGASFIYRPDTLFLLEDGDRSFLLPNDPFENSLSEQWYIDPAEGTFNLSISCNGIYDMLLRRRFAGLSREEKILTVSEWAWLSGRVLSPDSISISDPYDLGSDMSFSVQGTLWLPPEEPVFAFYLPLLRWGEVDSIPDRVCREWAVSSVRSFTAPDPLILEIIDDTAYITDTSGVLSVLPAFLEIDR